MKRSIRARFGRQATIALFIGPSLSVIFAVLILPVFGALYLSTQDFVKKKLQYVGLTNYPKALNDRATWHSLWVNVEFTVLTVAFSLMMGLFLALLLNEQRWGRRFFSTAFMIPWPILSVVVGINFIWMFDANYGVINQILLQLGLIDTYRSFLGNTSTALLIVLLASVWKESPFFMIMLLAGLQAIPTEQYEAAAVDGATWWQRLWYITLPNLRKIILIATLLQLIWRFREFDLIQVITHGGPNRATEVLSVLVYKYAFEYFRFGKGAAIAVFMSLFSLALSLIYLRILRRQEV